jgi:hypothetical protein
MKTAHKKILSGIVLLSAAVALPGAAQVQCRWNGVQQVCTPLQPQPLPAPAVAPGSPATPYRQPQGYCYDDHGNCPRDFPGPDPGGTVGSHDQFN